MILVIQSVLYVEVMLKLKILNTSSCVAIFILFKDLRSSVILTKLTKVLFTQLDTKEQVNILLYDYPPSKSNALNQDITKFVINFLKKSGRFDKPLISLNQWFYVLLFLFLPICLLHVVVVVVVVVFLLENKCNFAAYNWLKISC